MNQYEAPAPDVRDLATSSSRNEIRLVEEVMPASQAPVCIAAYSSLEGTESTAAPAVCSTMSISREPPRTFRPLASSGATIGLERLATPPACQTQVSRMMPLSARKSVSALPTGSFFHFKPC